MIAGYEDMFERLFRDLGADTPLRSLADGRLRGYFADFKAYRVLSETEARQALVEGKNVQRLTIERWTAQPAESQAIERVAHRSGGSSERFLALVRRLNGAVAPGMTPGRFLLAEGLTVGVRRLDEYARILRVAGTQIAP
jgi:hypothetical protein